MKIFLLTIFVPFVAGGILSGGIQKIENPSFKDVPVVKAVDAVNAFFRGEEGDNAVERKPKAILSATSQVVTGILYEYKIRFSKGEGYDICNVKVWAREWMPKPEDKYITTVDNCKSQTPMALPGGEEKMSLNDTRVQQALVIFTDTVNGKSNNMYRQIPTKGYATIQVVAGYIYRFKGVTFSTTSCSNNNDNNLGKVSAEECPLAPDNGGDSQPICGKVTWKVGDSQPEPHAEIVDC